MRLAPQEIRTYHVVAVTAQRRPLFQVTATAELLQQTLFDYRKQGKYLLHAYVIMPNHFHAILTPAPDVSLEKAIQFIKGGFSFRLKSKRDIWQRSFNETQIQTLQQFRECRRYIEDNPVRKCRTTTSHEYPFSSAFHTSLDALPTHPSVLTPAIQ